MHAAMMYLPSTDQPQRGVRNFITTGKPKLFELDYDIRMIQVRLWIEGVRATTFYTRV